MNWIFPMAGKGTRTRQLGGFKPFIEISGTKIIGWLFRSIRDKVKDSDRLIFITTEGYCENFDVPQVIANALTDEGLNNSFELLVCIDTPPGPSATVYQAKKLICTDEPAIVVNCDQYIDFDMFDMIEAPEEKSGFLPIYAEFGQKSSYVEIENGIITRILEKDNISNLASAGVYAVSHGRALIWAIEKQFADKQTTNNEFYVGVALNNLIRENYRFYPTCVRAKYDLGNVRGINLFKEALLKRTDRVSAGCAVSAM